MMPVIPNEHFVLRCWLIAVKFVASASIYIGSAAADENQHAVGVFLAKPCSIALGPLESDECKSKQRITDGILEEFLAGSQVLSNIEVHVGGATVYDRSVDAEIESAKEMIARDRLKVFVRVAIMPDLRKESDAWKAVFHIHQAGVVDDVGAGGTDWASIGAKVDTIQESVYLDDVTSYRDGAEALTAAIQRLFPDMIGSKSVFVGCFEQQVVPPGGPVPEEALYVYGLVGAIPFDLPQSLAGQEEFHHWARKLEDLDRYSMVVIDPEDIRLSCDGNRTDNYLRGEKSAHYFLSGDVQLAFGEGERRYALVVRVRTGTRMPSNIGPYNVSPAEMAQHPSALIPPLARHIVERWDEVVPADHRR